MKTYTIVKYRGTGNLYKILSLDCKLKNPETRVWQEAVIYRGYKIYDTNTNSYSPDPDPKIWVREKNDFTNKFEIYG